MIQTHGFYYARITAMSDVTVIAFECAYCYILLPWPGCAHTCPVLNTQASNQARLTLALFLRSVKDLTRRGALVLVLTEEPE